MKYPNFSVIIIFKDYDSMKKCSKSVLRSVSYLNEPQNYEILTSDSPNKSRARNDLCRKAKGEILVFIDSDALATDFWLHEILKPFQDPNICVVGGCHILKQDADFNEVMADKILCFPLATWKSAARYSVKGKIRVTDESELSSCNLAIRKQVFLKAGGFPVDIIPCEENVLLNRIESQGYKMVYNPLSIVFHARDPLFLPYARKMFYYAHGRALMMKKGKGSLKMFPKLSLEILYFIVGLCLHYISYISGLIYGLIYNFIYH